MHRATHLAFGLALLILGGIDLLWHRSMERLIAHNQTINDSHHVIHLVEQLQARVVDVETAGRGYVMAGQEHYLEPYHAALGSLRQLQTDLEKRARWKALAVPVAEKLSFHATMIRLRRERGFRAGLDYFLSGRGQELTDEIRKLAAEISEEEHRSVAHKAAAAADSAAGSRRLMLIGDVLGFGLLLWIYVTLTWEIRGRRKTQQELVRQTAILKSIVDHIADAVVVADQNQRLVIFNPAAERMFGPLAAEAEPGQWPERYRLYLPDGVTPFPVEQLPLVRTARGEQVDEVELFVRPPEAPGGLWIRVTARPIRDGEGRIRGGVAVCRDVTHLKLAHESEIRKLNKELEQRVLELTAVNAELEAFTHTVSHDLRAPIRQIDGFARILLEEIPGLSAAAQHYFHRIRQGSSKMGRMVDGLLALARVGRQEIRKQATALGPMIGEIIRELKPDTASRIVDWQVGPLPEVECDPALMKIVFTNLLSNAVKFTRTRPRAMIHVGLAPGSQVGLFVRDNGVGFNMKYAHKLFGVFQRLHGAEEFEGIGLGLATAQRIVNRHGGKIRAEAEPDCGASFYVTFGTQTGGKQDE